MKLTKFRITDYKSIANSGACVLASDLTVFVGKNESGKTAILEALQNFDKQVTAFPAEAFPVTGPAREPAIEMCFEPDQADWEAFQARSQTTVPRPVKEYVQHNGLLLSKSSGGTYDLADESLRFLLAECNRGQRSLMRREEEKLSGLLEGRVLPAVDWEAGVGDIQDRVQQLFAAVKAILPSLNNEGLQHQVVESLRFIKVTSRNLTQETPQVDFTVFFLENMVALLPEFIFFSEFQGLLPFEIPVSEANQNQSVRDFARIAGLNIDAISETADLQRRINMLNYHSAVISGDFLSAWGQNRMELVVRPEGDKLLFGVKEAGKTDVFKVSQRSRGFQWFLSFYLRLNSQKGRNRIVLIDEPGMNLHSRAQGEILKFLEQVAAPGTQIIFSTHSPYLIDHARLDRVRLVVKDEKTGTEIKNHLSPDTDEETMAPVTTALDRDPSGRIAEFGSKNLLVIGLASYYFLEAFRALVRPEGWEGVRVVPVAARRDIPQLVSLLLGYGHHFVIASEKEEDVDLIRHQLPMTFGLPASRVITLPGKDLRGLVDLLTRDDFCRYILNKSLDIEIAEPQSQYLEKFIKNSVVLAKEFFMKAGKSDNAVRLSEESLAACAALFKKIKDCLDGKINPDGRALDKIVKKEINRFAFFPFFRRAPAKKSSDEAIIM